MSGLAALAGPSAGAGAIRKMLAAAPHRGSVEAVDEGPGWAVGVQNAADSAHPFTAAALAAEGKLAVAMSGCIYQGSGVVPAGEAVMAVADAFTEGTVETLSGSFAAVVIDLGRKTTFAIRSRVGERPLFCRTLKDGIAFASEPKQLAAATGRRPIADQEALLDAAASKQEGVEGTGYRGVSRLAPGSVVTFDGHRLFTNVFWDLSGSVGTSTISFEDAVDEFRSLLQVAVGRRLTDRSGLLLSGGLDSASVAAEAAPLHLKSYGSPLRVLSAGYPRFPNVDESEYTREIVKKLGCEAIWIEPSADAPDDLQARALLEDGPDIGILSFNLSQILEAARSNGLVHLLDGNDGDTVFGLPGGAATDLLRSGRLQLLASFAKFRRRRLGLSWPGVLRRVLLPPVLDVAPGLRPLWSRLHPPRPPAPPEWTTGPLRERLSQPAPPRNWKQSQWSRISCVQVRTLELLERAGLSAGAGIVHPLADPDLVDFLARLPAEVQFEKGAAKSLVRAVYRDRLPSSVLQRQDKTLFDDFELSRPLRNFVDPARWARLLPGVDWDLLERRVLEDDLGLEERVLVRRVVTADFFMAGA